MTRVRSHRALVALLAMLTLLLATPRRASAQPAKAAAQLVLVVANNRGAELGRAELQYADDDGAKYRALFRARALEPRDVQLLTRFDRDTSRLFAEAPDGPPTRAALAQKVELLAARRAELAREGRDVELIFVFAGHGDIDRGRGFVQLEDGTFDADALARLLRRIDASRAHVILDSCNSLFLVSPRKPGGRHVATARDAVRALHERLPRAGVFLSTSADGEVFEWSELAAGIFSHAVRSGLAGAADADGDGKVTYAELRAFVAVATRDVKNPRYRPQVFARGPDGDDHAALFAPRLAVGRRVTVNGPLRTTIRDADDVPWIDAHVEAGARVELLVPSAVAQAGATKETLDVTGGAPRVSRREPLDEGETERPARVAARGPGDVFRMLFVRPFGPRALALEESLPHGDDLPAYGLSRDDVSRFSTLVRQVAESERSRRGLAGLSLLVGGVAAAGAGAVLVATDPDAETLGISYLATAGGLLVAAPIVGFRSGPGEVLEETYRRDLARTSPAAAVARAEAKLFEIARAERRDRLIGAAALGVAFAAAGTVFTVNELGSATDPTLRSALVPALVLTAVGGVTMLQPTPIERLAKVWSEEPARPSPQISVAPVAGGAPGISFGGRF